jgi:hypothetical protein
MSQLNKYYIVRRADIFIKFKLLGIKTSDVSVVSIKTISRLGVRPGRTICVDVTHVDD